MPPPDEFDPPAGLPVLLEPGLRRIVAPNPSPMTYRGTNTYLLGDTDLAVIDPGPASDAHLAAILSAVGPGQRITHIVVTHSHLDHAPLARPLSAATGAPVFGFGDVHAGRTPEMAALAAASTLGGGEGLDHDFVPDTVVQDRQDISGAGWRLRVLHTPGHLGNHICLGWGTACFTADHVMGWASSLVSPPDGDLTAFMASCARLQQEMWRVFYPGHGAPVTAPAARLAWLVAHRKTREAAILDALVQGPRTARQIAEAVYVDTPAALLGAATRNVLAHLIDLTGKMAVAPKGALSADVRFERRTRP